MFLHIGQDTVIKIDDILGIFDLETTTVTKKTMNYLKKAEEEGRTVNVSTDIPKSFVVCSEKNEPPTVYISQLSTGTLLGRMENKEKIPDFGGLIFG